MLHRNRCIQSVIVCFIVVMALQVERSYARCFSPCKNGQFDVRVHGGVEPIVWHGRGGIFGENEVFTGRAQVPTVTIQGQCIPKFSTFFNTPWVVGGQVGYSWRSCWRPFLEANYAQASPKNSCKTQLSVFSSTGAPAGTTLNFTLNTYRFADAYVGLYYYVATCYKVNLFIGGKVGLIHHFRSNFSLTETLPLEETIILDLVPSCPKRAFIESNTTFAGGAALGFDYEMCKNLFIGIIAEVVANRGPETNCNIPVSIPNIPTVRIFFGKIKSEVRFPVMATIRYRF